MQATLRANDLELFVEHPMPVVGAPATFVVHVTRLSDGSPRVAGPLQLRGRSASGGVVGTSTDGPARTGIYLPEVAFPSAGEWEVRVELEVDGQAVSIALPPVQVLAGHAELDALPHPEDPEGVAFTKEQQWRLGTRLAPVAEHLVADSVEVPAVVRPAAERQAEVSPPIGGHLEVSQGSALPHVGAQVAAGEVLAYVRPPFSDYLARLQEARAEIVRAGLAVEQQRARVARTEALLEAGARSERELEEEHFALQLALAAEQASRAVADALAATGLAPSESGQLRFELRAPIAGIIRRVGAVNGSFVAPGDVVFELRDSSLVHLDALVRPALLERLTAHERLLVIRARGAGGPRELEIPDAELVFVGDEVDPHTLTVPVHFEVPNPEQRLRIGELVEVQLRIAEPSPVLAVPADAIVEIGGEPAVFVQLSGERFERRNVELGSHSAGLVEIRSGLVAGEWIVIRGAYAVHLASLSETSIGHGHAH